MEQEGGKPHIIFPHQFLKHPNLEIVAAVTILYLTKAAVYQIFFFFYPNENQFQISGSSEVHDVTDTRGYR